ncbi:uncharacterized protein [Nicotiana tomentosiformis]|uniref:uncharacterized protein n=1 Tax=Nicotiana tomentosiformis TaxID=4098 RepID=UPI00388C6962
MLKLNSLRFHHFFDDDAENHSVSEENRVQTWNNYQYHSGKPVVVVANENSVDLEKHRGIVGSRIDEKPLLLPIRSLKSTFPESISTTSPKSLSPSWTLTGKSIELAKILHKRKINIACVQETRADGFKLWYSERVRGKNRVGILVDKDLRELVIEVKRVNDMLMAIKIVVGGYTLNIVSAYAPHVGLDEEVKRYFWEDLDGLVWGIPSTEKLIIGGDFNGHIGMLPGGYDGVHGGFGFGDRNGGGTSLLEYAKAFELVIVNSCYPKKAEHLITFQSTVAETQIDYLLLRKCDRGLCTDCKVIPSENLTTRHMLLVMD